MGRRSNNVENFLRSMERYCESEARNRKPRVFGDELFVFGDFGGSRRRRSYADYIVLGDRRRGDSFSGESIVEGLCRSDLEREAFFRAIESGRDFSVMPCAGRTAILYTGLLSSCRLGVLSLTQHSPRATAASLSGSFGGLFDDVRFDGAFSDPDGNANACSFVNDFMTFKSDMLSACGIERVEGRIGFDTMLYSAADAVGCSVVLAGNRFLRSEYFDRDTSAAMMLCLLSAIRSVSEDRCAYVSVGEADGDAAIGISFKPYGIFDADRAAFLTFCRSLSELHGIPFSFVTVGDTCRADFIPMKLDPSEAGLKAGVIFDFSSRLPEQGFHDAL